MRDIFRAENKVMTQAKQAVGIFALSVLAFSSLCALPGFSDDTEVHLPELGGRVLDTQRRPVPGAQIKLMDENGDQLVTTSSASDGSFSFQHKVCETCTLQVVPDGKSSFASALIENIPGSINRKFQVTLQPGFKVTGRITGDGKGLKGLIVKVIGSSESAAKVHSGGEAKTSRNGSFEMNLTAGKKILSVHNDHYMNFARRYEHELVVTADNEIGTIDLPKAQ